MTQKPNYHEFQILPAYTAPQWATPGGGKVLNEADPYKWSGKNAPPPIGAEVKAWMNNLGQGVVTGYFAEYGWLGVLVKLNAPPKWWIEQMKNMGKDPATTNCHLFGLDLEPRKMSPKAQP